MNKTVSNGKVISLEYTLKLENGEVVDTNVGGNPLTYTQGDNQIIRGVESAVEGMEVGQAKQAVVPLRKATAIQTPARSTKCQKRSFLKKFRWALSSMGKTPAAARSDRSCQPSRTIPSFWISTIPLPARHCTST